MQSGLFARVLVALLAAALPPVFAVGLLVALSDREVLDVGRGTLFGGAVIIAALWAAFLAAVASRGLGGDFRRLVELAAHGRPDAGSRTEERSEMADAQRRLAELLGERDRQMGRLASESASAPISIDPSSVARHVVEAVRRVTGDATWILAVLDSSDETLDVGSYTGDAAPSAIGDLHRWASVTAAEAEPGSPRARLSDGPWGSFVVARVSAGSELRAVLLAPWEGRAQPTPAELTLYDLLGQHAATSLEHAILYARARRQAEELDRLAAVQADFLRGVSHDLQTPLTRIGAIASELRASRDTPARGAHDLETISYQADRLRRMVGQLLTMSSLEAGALHPRSEVFRVEPMVRRAWDSLRADRRLELTAEGPDRLAVGDPDRLEQAIWALLDNAVKYSAAGSTVSVTLRCRAQRAGDPASESGHVEEIEIGDQGIGMEPADVARATERFYRSAAARELVPDGSGIGLYTAGRLAELMGGRLAIASVPKEGTTVRITVPAEVAGAVEPAWLREAS